MNIVIIDEQPDPSGDHGEEAPQTQSTWVPTLAGDVLDGVKVRGLPSLRSQEITTNNELEIFDETQLSLRLEVVAAMLPPPTPQRILRKAVQAVHSYPTNGEHTALTRRLFNVLVEITQEVFRKTSTRDRDLIRAARGTPQFSVPTRRLVEMMGMTAGAHYDRVHSAMESLFSWEIRWNLMGDSNGDTSSATSGDVVLEAVTSRLISQWGRGDGPRSGLITFEFPHDTLMMVLEPRPYAQLDLRVINELGSASAIGLYECCARYLGTTHKVTSILRVEEWIAMIAGPGKYAGSYFDFARYCLKPAIRQLELASSCPFTVEPRVIYGARKKVMGLQFKMSMKHQRALDMEMPMTWDTKTLEALTQVYNMSRSEIALMARTASESEVLEAMQRDAVMVSKKSKGSETIHNRARYLRGILRNVQSGKEREAEPEEEADEIEAISQGPNLRAQAALRLKSLREAHISHQIERLGEELSLLPESELEPLQEAFAKSVESNRTITGLLKRGWNPPHPAVKANFHRWILEEQPELAKRMLRRDEDHDFALWMMLNPDAEKNAAAAVTPAK